MLIRPLNFTQNDLCATSDKNTNFNISVAIGFVSNLSCLFIVPAFARFNFLVLPGRGHPPLFGGSSVGA